MISHYTYEVIRKIVNEPENFQFVNSGDYRYIYYGKSCNSDKRICILKAWFPYNSRHAYWRDTKELLTHKEILRLLKLRDYCEAMQIRNLKLE